MAALHPEGFTAPHPLLPPHPDSLPSRLKSEGDSLGRRSQITTTRLYRVRRASRKGFPGGNARASKPVWRSGAGESPSEGAALIQDYGRFLLPASHGVTRAGQASPPRQQIGTEVDRAGLLGGVPAGRSVGRSNLAPLGWSGWSVVPVATAHDDGWMWKKDREGFWG